MNPESAKADEALLERIEKAIDTAKDEIESGTAGPNERCLYALALLGFSTFGCIHPPNALTNHAVNVLAKSVRKFKERLKELDEQGEPL